MRRQRPSVPSPDARERGSGILLVALVLAVVAVALAVVLVSARAVHARARAQQAADAAVLAALVEGEDAAHRLAAANGATIVSSWIAADAAEVVVVVDGVRARARAARPVPPR